MYGLLTLFFLTSLLAGFELPFLSLGFSMSPLSKSTSLGFLRGSEFLESSKLSAALSELSSALFFWLSLLRLRLERELLLR